MVEKKLEDKKMKTQILRSPSHQKYYVTNVVGGFTSQDFRFELMNEILANEKKRSYVSDAMIILSPIGAKRLLVELSKSISDYEKKEGEIPINPKEEYIVSLEK